MTTRQQFILKRKVQRYYPQLIPGIILFLSLGISITLLLIGIKIGSASAICIKENYPQNIPTNTIKEAGNAGQLDVPME